MCHNERGTLLSVLTIGLTSRLSSLPWSSWEWMPDRLMDGSMDAERAKCTEVEGGKLAVRALMSVR